MSILPSYLKYTEGHTWVSFDEDGYAVIGITDYAQDSLGTLLEVYLPSETADFEMEDEAMSLVSERSQLEIFSPISGEVVEINEALLEIPHLINMEPYDGGWLFKLSAHNMAEIEDLMNDQDYAEYIERPMDEVDFDGEE
ncbi:MAG TPA: glycine cleavage system protein H [Thiomicrospira sp.]|jgi:glycine cleavage system H protein|nr:glycine cleavage system protein H [Thiomicrospira sp.]